VSAFRVAVAVHYRAGVFDPQGQAVARGLRSLGYVEVADVRVGRHLEVTLEARDAEEARRRGETMCRDLLANPVLEEFRVEVHPA
jgi:phosphoribosylformylglycinamidine synthase PurS subunit